MIGESKSYYVSNVLWADLANEVDEIRDMLLQPEEADEDEDMMSQKTSSSGSNAALFGSAHSHTPCRPIILKSRRLWICSQSIPRM